MCLVYRQMAKLANLSLTVLTLIIFIKERMATKLKRMQEMEESTRKLVESAEKLLQQQSFERRKSKGLPDVVPKMSSREIRKTAWDVALRFKEIQQELLTVDLSCHTCQKRKHVQPITKRP